jgi:hypothetical protein
MKHRRRPDCWHIYYGDVQAGTIAMRAGNPHDTDPWNGLAASLPGGFDLMEICLVGWRFQTADATAQPPIKMLLRG